MTTGVVGDGDQGVERASGRATVDGRGGQFHAVFQALGFARHDQRGSGVEQHDIPIRAGFAVQERAQLGGVHSGLAAFEVSQRRARKARILRRDLEHVDIAVDEFRDHGGTRGRQFVHAVGAVHDPGVNRTEVFNASAIGSSHFRL